MKAIVVGSGFGGLSAAALLAKDGFKVTVLEKNEQIGGRASVYSENDFNFDMGPSWYLMPDVYEKFFAEFGKKPEDYFELDRLDPSYRIFLVMKKLLMLLQTLKRTMNFLKALKKAELKN